MHQRQAALCVSVLFAAIMIVSAPRLPGQDPGAENLPPADTSTAASDSSVDLSVEQAQLADRWDRLEQIAARLAELSASSDPYRAELLRKALAEAREKEVPLRFGTIVNLLDKEQFSAASKNQQALQAELQQLLELLLQENRAEELRSQQEWLKMQLKEVNRIIRLQRGVKARTEGGDDADRLAEDQQKVGERTGQLADEVESAEGGSPDGAQGEGQDNQGGSESDGQQPSEGPEGTPEDAPEGGDQEESPREVQNGESEGKAGDPSPDPSNGQSPSGEPSDQSQPSESGEGSQGQQGQQGQPSQGEQGQEGSQGEGGDAQSPPAQQQEPSMQQRLRAAQESMDKARQKLEEAERDGAAEEQEKALRELEEAKAELERVLRQLREEEMERTLTLLEARFRRMLEMQVEVYEGTVRLNEVPEDERDHDDEIEGGRLSRQEEIIVREADKALEILLEEGSSVAFPEAVTQMRTDMQDVVGRLSRLQVGEITQAIEQDIIAQLEESIEVLQQALEDLEKDDSPPGQAQPGAPQDPRLVDMLEEVKMIRALQMRVNRRTQRYAEMIDGNAADNADLLDALRRLAEREESVYKATRDLHLQRNR